MKVLLITHLNALQAAIAEVSTLVHEAGIAGEYNEAQIEKLKVKIEDAANTITDELGKAFLKVEFYFGKKPAAETSPDPNPGSSVPSKNTRRRRGVPVDNPPAPADPPPAE